MVNFTVNSLTDDCDLLQVFFRTDALPCTDDNDLYDDFFCTEVNREYFDDLTTYAYVSGYQDYDELTQFVSGGYWYIGISRYYGSDYDTQCSYTLQASFSGNCAAGTVGIPYQMVSEDEGQCSDPYIVINTATSAPQSFNFSNTASTTYSVFKGVFPQGGASVAVTLVTNSDETNFLAANLGSPLYESERDNCDIEFADENNGIYTYVGTCYLPKAGPYYMVVYDADEELEYFNGTLTLVVTTCGAGFGGVNCTAPASPLNLTATNYAFTTTIPFINEESYRNGYAFAYYYWDIPGNFTAATTQVTITIAGADSTGVAIIRRDGWSEYSSDYGYEVSEQLQDYPATFYFGQFDWQIPGRIVFGLGCDTTPHCTVTMAFNNTLYSTSGTTGSTTGNTATTGTTSSTTAATSSTTGITSGAVTSGAVNMTLTTRSISTGRITSATTTASTTASSTTASSTVKATTVGTTSQHTSSAISIVPSLFALFVGLLALAF